jgi:hypothetical protein
MCGSLKRRSIFKGISVLELSQLMDEFWELAPCYQLMILITMIGAVLIVGSRVHWGPMHAVFSKKLTKIPEIPSAPDHLTAIQTPEKNLKILEFSSYTSICNSLKSHFWLLKHLGGEVIRWRECSREMGRGGISNSHGRGPICTFLGRYKQGKGAPYLQLRFLLCTFGQEMRDRSSHPAVPKLQHFLQASYSWRLDTDRTEVSSDLHHPLFRSIP